MLRWLGTNLRTFALALVLAIAVWVSAVTAADPDVAETYPTPIPIEIIGQDPSLIIVGTYPKQVNLNLRAPRSIWEQLQADSRTIRVVADLSGLSAGQHRVTVQVQISLRPVRIISVSPESFDITLEPLITRTLPINAVISGEAAVGFQAGELSIEPQQVTISGPQSLIDQAQTARALLDLNNARTDIDSNIAIKILDANNLPINGLNITPESVRLSMPITQQGGYRDLAVKVVVQGQVANGYRLTNVSVYPPVVTVYASDPALVLDLPGYVETEPLQLTGAKEDIETRLTLQLPVGISVVGEQSVKVQAGVTPIESSITIANKRIEIVGLGAGLSAQISPQVLDVILSGPLPVLDKLTSNDVHVVVDLTGLMPGTHQVTPRVDLLVDGIRVETLNPATVEVTIVNSTPTPRP